MPQFAYRIRPTRVAMLTDGPSESEARVLAEHFAYLQGHCAGGRVLLAGRTLIADESAFGIVVVEVHSEADARELMLADPAVRDGVMQADLFPFRVALRSPGAHGDVTAPPTATSCHEGAAP